MARFLGSTTSIVPDEISLLRWDINGIYDTSTENKVVELKEEEDDGMDNVFFFFFLPCLFVTRIFEEALRDIKERLIRIYFF